MEAGNTLAIRNRALAYVAIVWNNKSLPLDKQALADADECCRLEPSSFEAAFCAAIVYGEAARKDRTFDAQAVSHLTDALRKGMPVETMDPYFVQLKRLGPMLDDETLANAKRDAKYHIDFRPAIEPPDIANWKAFQKQFGTPRALLAPAK